MAFRFDMRGKTSQQQIIVAKRDAEHKKSQKEARAKREEKEKTSNNINTYILLAINKDTCPTQDNIIINQQCSGCKYYKGFELYKQQPCVKCSYHLNALKQHK